VPRARRPWLAIAVAVAVALLAAGVVASFVQPRPASEAPAASAAPAPPCPFGFVDRPGRSAALVRRLQGTTRGAALLERLGETELRYCFGAPEGSSVTESRVLLLDADAPADALAARAGHLIHHVVHGPPFPDAVPADADCEAVVEAALEAEAAGYALELALRRELGLARPRYPFERDFWAAAEDEREAVIADYLRDHPDGGPNVTGLAAGYRERCEVERARAGR
jgi:hypothetical protein